MGGRHVFRRLYAKLRPHAAMSEHERFLRFLFFGGSAAAVNLIARWLLNHIWSFELSVAVAYLIGMVVAFTGTRLFVFQPSANQLWHQFVRFALVNSVSFTLVWTISVGLAKFAFPAIGLTWHADTLAHFIGVLSPTIVSYIGHKHYSFGH